MISGEAIAPTGLLGPQGLDERSMASIIDLPPFLFLEGVPGKLMSASSVVLAIPLRLGGSCLLDGRGRGPGEGSSVSLRLWLLAFSFTGAVTGGLACFVTRTNLSMAPEVTAVFAAPFVVAFLCCSYCWCRLC